MNKNICRRKKVGCDIGTLPPYQRVACEILQNARRPLTTNEVADYGNMSWLTAKKHLEGLENQNIGIHSNRKGNAKLWFIE